jgi:hypothetical protein
MATVTAMVTTAMKNLTMSLKRRRNQPRSPRRKSQRKTPRRSLLKRTASLRRRVASLMTSLKTRTPRKGKRKNPSLKSLRSRKSQSLEDEWLFNFCPLLCTSTNL